jgi:signal transduction histidine kinase
VGIFLIFVMDMAVLLYLLRDMAGKQSVWEGIHQISGGDLSYKIDLTTLQGETYEMGKAVNEMGDGLQKAVDAIVKNERLKAELITNVSHDIKTPLTSIVNYVDLLKRENLQGERVQNYIRILDQKSQRLKQLTEDLVEASKISSGNIELQMVRMQLQSMIRQAYGEFQERLEERSLTPVWNMETEPACIMADGRQLWRILENLLGNIYKYALEGTRIYIDLYREEGRVYLSLKNTSAQKLTVSAQELAGRFVRGDRSRSTEGSGLGLSIAQSLTEIQGGTFELTVDGDLFKVRIGFEEV